MLRILTATSLLALASTPALAQSDMGANMQPTAPTEQVSAQPATPATPATPAEPITDMDPMDSTSTTPATPAAPAIDSSSSAVAAPAAEPRTVTVQKLVDAEFPAYDANKNGNLEQAEFGNWVLALYAASGDAAAPKDPAAKAKWSKAAFATADTDKNKAVTKAEMNVFLVG